jgi:hypothetical protein
MTASAQRPSPDQEPIEPTSAPARASERGIRRVWLAVAATATCIAVALVWWRTGVAGALVVATIGVMGGVVIWLDRDHYAFVYAYFLRFPAGIYAVAALLPVVCAYPVESFAGNLLVLRPDEGLWAGMALGLVLFACAAAARAVLRSMPDRADLPLARSAAGRKNHTFRYGPRGWVALPLPAATTWAVLLWERSPRHATRLVAMFGLGLALVFGGQYLIDRLVRSGLRTRREKNSSGQHHPIARAMSVLGRGYGGEHWRQHFAAGVMFLLALALYVLGWHCLAPPHPVVPAFPPVAFLLVTVLMLAWVLPGLSFFFDKFRIPVWLVLLPAWLTVQMIGRPDNFYALLARAESSEPPSAIEVLKRRLVESAACGKPRPLVAVMSTGGGITAALWTGSVLVSLQDELDDDFARSLALVSSASGGSVGAMFYVDGFTKDGPPTPETRARVIASAGRSSLRAGAWGFAFPDFARAFLGLVPQILPGRGWALEQIWKEGLTNPAVTLGDWSAGVRDGWRPLAIMNATEVESGAAVRLSPADLGGPTSGDPLCPTPPGAHGPVGWDRSAGISWSPRHHDLAVTTAARLSATFPYVTPVARALLPDGRSCGYHLADGGYFDNFGVHAAIEQLDQALHDFEREHPDSRAQIFLVEVRAFPPTQPKDAVAGWEGISLGPILTLLNVRAASQGDRNEEETALFQARWERRADIRRFTFTLDPHDWPGNRGRTDVDEGDCPIADFASGDRCPHHPDGEQIQYKGLPTSWHLSCAETQAIVCYLHNPAIARERTSLKREFAAVAGACR